MNTLIVYDSQYGNTERIAQAIADTLRAFGQAQAVRADPAHLISLRGVDLLILGCPTQGFRPGPVMQSFLGSVSSRQIHDLLRARILRRELAPGERLVPVDLAVSLGVSITPVRDAVNLLASEGLVIVAPRRGTVPYAAGCACRVQEMKTMPRAHWDRRPREQR